MKTIRTKADAKEFVQWLKEPWYDGRCFFTFHNGDLFVGDWGGYETLQYYPESDSFGVYCHGQGWSDQAPSEMDEDEMVELVWRERKWINKELRNWS